MVHFMDEGWLHPQDEGYPFEEVRLDSPEYLEDYRRSVLDSGELARLVLRREERAEALLGAMIVAQRHYGRLGAVPVEFVARLLDGLDAAPHRGSQGRSATGGAPMTAMERTRAGAPVHPDDGYAYDGCDGPSCRNLRAYRLVPGTEHR